MPNMLVNGYLIVPDLSMHDLHSNTIVFSYLKHLGLSDYLVAVISYLLRYWNMTQAVLAFYLCVKYTHTNQSCLEIAAMRGKAEPLGGTHGTQVFSPRHIACCGNQCPLQEAFSSSAELCMD